MVRDALADTEPVIDAPGSGLMPASGVAIIRPAAAPGALARVRVALAGLGAAVLGVVAHVLHHVGPLAGAALLAGASGRLLFALLGFVATVPMLRGMRRRTGSWRVPGGVLAVMAAMFVLSSLMLGPAITGSGDSDRATDVPPVTGPTPAGHDDHH
jgi:hypothetical protein